MSSISPNLGLTLADGTDTFDNDRFIKGNFQKIDDTILPKTKTIQTNSGLKMEIVPVTFTSNGSSSVVQTTGISYANTYTNPPCILPANVVVPESYIDTIQYPYPFAVTNTSFSAKLITVGGQNFGSGNIVMNFLVVGS